MASLANESNLKESRRRSPSLPHQSDRPTQPSTQPKIRNFLTFKAWPRFCVTSAIASCTSLERSLL
ncbi:hypothetical protein NDA01_28565 [Trichocoleus desertorum AS-A10]|uniref:hypothetical protein n=1 Tax=Trichocoleus desertorum TaxID=1481672 RepID=UPI00329A06A1